MQVDESLEDLMKETLRLLFRKWLATLLLHVLLQVEFKVFEYQEKLVLRVNDLLQSDST